MHWSSEYIGIPYLANGYDRAGCSCWGLVRMALMEQFGVTLPRHDEADIYDTKRMIAGYVPVDPPDVIDGDIYHLWGVEHGRKSPTHVGIAVGGKEVLHTETGTGAIVEHLASKRAAWRVICAYRPAIV